MVDKLVIMIVVLSSLMMIDKINLHKEQISCLTYIAIVNILKNVINNYFFKTGRYGK